MTTADDRSLLRPSLRLVLGAISTLGPGKAELLEHIRDTGSISAAGRQMNMSYKRAWMLVETMNADFREVLVESTRGGAKGGGARLTDTGMAVLAHYRGLEDVLHRHGAAQLTALRNLLRDIPERK